MAGRRLSILMSGLRSVQTYPMDKNILLAQRVPAFHLMQDAKRFAPWRPGYESVK